jgi:hypothetical protein
MMEKTENFINIESYLNYWNNFFVYWNNDKEGTFDNNVIWSKRKGKEWTTKKGIKKSTKLEPDVFPQPYLGDIHNHSVITLNLNPSRSKKYGDENFKEPDLNSKYNYEKYAESFPTYDTHNFWKNQKNWIDRIFEFLEEEKPSKKQIKPFAIEICPWGSKSFQKLKMDTQIISYLDKYVFDVIDKVIKNSNLKIVISVGKAYFDIFENKVSGFNKLEEISHKENKPEELNWPQKKDKNSGMDRDLERSFSIWKKGEILYFNTYASGSNSPPADHFDTIQNDLIKRHL